MYGLLPVPLRRNLLCSRLFFGQMVESSRSAEAQRNSKVTSIRFIDCGSATIHFHHVCLYGKPPRRADRDKPNEIVSDQRESASKNENKTRVSAYCPIELNIGGGNPHWASVCNEAAKESFGDLHHGSDST
jgi:hypothetical protein